MLVTVFQQEKTLKKQWNTCASGMKKKTEQNKNEKEAQENYD